MGEFARVRLQRVSTWKMDKDRSWTLRRYFQPEENYFSRPFRHRDSPTNHRRESVKRGGHLRNKEPKMFLKIILGIVPYFVRIINKCCPNLDLFEIIRKVFSPKLDS